MAADCSQERAALVERHLFDYLVRSHYQRLGDHEIEFPSGAKVEDDAHPRSRNATTMLISSEAISPNKSGYLKNSPNMMIPATIRIIGNATSITMYSSAAAAISRAFLSIVILQKS
jgi:hypothetical protein